MKTFFSGHDLMLSLFESYFHPSDSNNVYKEMFVEVPYELANTRSDTLFHILNAKMGGHIHSYHKELVRFAFELIKDKSEKGLKDCEIVLFSNVKDLGYFLNDLTFQDVKNYFEKNDERKQHAEKIIQGQYNCAVSNALRELFLEQNLRSSYDEMKQSIMNFIANCEKMYYPPLELLTKAQNGEMFQANSSDIAVIITDLPKIVDLSNEYVDNCVMDKYIT